MRVSSCSNWTREKSVYSDDCTNGRNRTPPWRPARAPWHPPWQSPPPPDPSLSRPHLPSQLLSSLLPQVEITWITFLVVPQALSQVELV